jgi:hypothetical protein
LNLSPYSLAWVDDSATELHGLASVLDAKSFIERTGGVALAQPPATGCYAFGILWAINDRKDWIHWQIDGPSGFTVGDGMISGKRPPLKCKTKTYTHRYLA